MYVCVRCATTEASAFALLALSLLFSLPFSVNGDGDDDDDDDDSTAMHPLSLSVCVCFFCAFALRRAASSRSNAFFFFFVLPSLARCRRRTKVCESLLHGVYAVCPAFSFLFYARARAHICSSIDRLDDVRVGWRLCMRVCASERANASRRRVERRNAGDNSDACIHTTRLSILLLLLPSWLCASRAASNRSRGSSRRRVEEKEKGKTAKQNTIAL